MRSTRGAALPQLGAALRRRREELGLTRLQLALRLGWRPGERTGWSPRTLVRLENGQRPVAHRGELLHLAEALGLGAQDLLDRADGAALPPPPAPAGGAGAARVLERLLAEQEEQTELLRRLVSAVEGDGDRIRRPG
jgi:transcriptional regulator with XRE-family HTH domain